MAKRLTDTEKWKKEWFRHLPLKMKVAWEYLRDNCDAAGVWDGDFGLMGFQVGEGVTKEECLSAFGHERFIALKEGKFLLPGFYTFQYGNEKSSKSPAHRSILKKVEQARLRALSLVPQETLPDPSPKGHPTLLVKEEVKVKVKEEEEVKAEVKATRVSPDSLAQALDEWVRTLKHFEIDRTPGERDHVHLARAIQEFGIEDVALALRGSRYEAPTQTFRPKEHLTLARIFGRDKSGSLRIDKFITLACQHKPAERQVYQPKQPEGSC